MTFIVGRGSASGDSSQTSTNPHLGFYLPVALQDADLFEAVVAFSESWRLSCVERQNDSTASNFYLNHRGRAVVGLRRRISSSDHKISASDESILTGVFLMRAAARLGCMSECRSHCAGVRQMIRLRGGVDNLGMNQFMKTGIQIAMSDPTIFTNHTDQTHEDFDAGSVRLHYPGVPFSSELKVMLSRLPKGCVEIAASGSGTSPLSHEVLHIVLALPTWIVLEKSLPEAKSYMPGHMFIQILLEKSTHPVEGMMCLAIVLYSKRASPLAEAPEILDPAFSRRLIELDEDVKEEADLIFKEFRFWVLLMAAEMLYQGTLELQHSVAEALDGLLCKEKWTWDWNCVEGALKKFYWTEELLLEWQRCWEKRVIQGRL